MGGLQGRPSAHARRGEEGARALSWKLEITNRARKDLGRLSQQDQGKVHAALAKLSDTEEGDVVRLKNIAPPEWRLRVGEVRVRFAYVYEAEAIVVLRVLPRGKAYDR